MRRDFLRGPDRGAFFLVQTGERMDANAIDAVFRKLNGLRGPEAKHPHFLRHSVAIHLLRGGADIRHVQAFLGHASIDHCNTYLRMVPGRLAEDYLKAMPEIAVRPETLP